MNKRNRIILGVVVVLLLSAAALELFFFRFHTYFITTEVMETLPPMPSGAPLSQQPATLVEGSFVEVDAVHKGSGTARIIEQTGKRYLRFENFSVTNGPDLYVYLAEGAAPTREIASLGAYADLGRLKGNVGDQNYEIPAGTPASYRTAVIWCRQFGVLFSFALMR